MRNSMMARPCLALFVAIACAACLGPEAETMEDGALGEAEDALLAPCAAVPWSSGFSDAEAEWKQNPPAYWPSIQFQDLNGDGKSDVCGRGSNGIRCAISSGARFSAVLQWSARAEYTDAVGWGGPSLWQTLRFPDINGDGKHDACARGSTGMTCALSTGVSFDLGGYSSGFADAWGWAADPSLWRTIQHPDVNGDGWSDVCGRKFDGIWCELSNGATFTPATSPWTGGFADAWGWGADPSRWQTIRFPDVNGDGKSDVCGRNVSGIWCELSNGAGFTPAAGPWTGGFSGGWDAQPSYWKTIQFADVNGDGKSDVCGRGTAGIWCEVSNGTSFTPAGTPWTNAFSDATGWASSESSWGTIRLADVNGDGMADACGRSSGGIYCGLSTGTSFAPLALFTPSFSDAAGWNTDPSYWGTIQFTDVNGDGKMDVCGRAADGLHCALSRYGNSC